VVSREVVASIGARASAHTLQRLVDPPQGAVLQRAVGYEFETGWLVADRSNVEDWKKSGAQGVPPRPQPLKKKDHVYGGSGFKVEADEAVGGNAELEFILHPPVEADESGLVDLTLRMAHMTVLGEKLIGTAGGSEQPFTMNAATGDVSHQRLVVTPNDAVLRAGPQVTAGISLAKVGALGTKQGTKELPPAFSATVAQAGNMRENVGELLKFLPEKIQPGSAELRSLLGLCASYLDAGERAVFYPKQITDRLLLARTDFATLFRMLTDNEQAYFKKKPEDFVVLAITAAGLMSPDPEKHVITNVMERETMDSPRAPVGPTRRKWLWFITQGYDLLSSAHYKELESTYEGTPEANLGKSLESMGELGAKTEEVNEARKRGGIFELRGAAVTRTKIPLTEWMPFALQVMQYLIALEKGQ
jgi:hypothetical protein